MNNKEVARAIVRADYLLATEPFQSSEETRYYLCGLSIEPHPRAGAIIVATDGHMLSCIHNEDAIVSGEPTIWSLPWKSMLSGPMRSFKSVHKNIVGRNIYADMHRGIDGSNSIRLVWATCASEVFNNRGIGDNEDPIVIFTHSGNSGVGHIWVDGTFPEWRRVVPTDRKAETFAPAIYNAKYVAKVAAFGHALSAAADGERQSNMAIFSNDAASPGVARFSRPEGFVVIMPIRDGISIDVATGGLPSWFEDQGDPPVERTETPDLKVAA